MTNCSKYNERVRHVYTKERAIALMGKVRKLHRRLEKLGGNGIGLDFR